MKLRTLTIAVTCVFLTGCVTTASQGKKMREDIDALKQEQKQLTEKLESQKEKLTEMISSANKDVKELRKVTTEAKKLLQRNSADFGQKLEQTRGEVQELRGRLQEAEFKLRRLGEELKMFKEDVDIRLASGDQLSKELPEKADALFNYAKNKFDDSDYRVARRAFETHLSAFPESEERAFVRFYLGEIHFKQKEWVQAVFEYRRILKNHPDSDKMPAATFRIGESFIKLGRCKDAKPFFESVRQDYSGSDYSNKARQKIQEIESGRCK